MLEDNNIRDAFNNPSSLKDEDWLKVSDNLFDNISGEIFEEEKPTRKPFWMFFGIGISILALAILGYTFVSSKNTPSTPSSELSTIPTKINAPTPKASTKENSTVPAKQENQTELSSKTALNTNTNNSLNSKETNSTNQIDQADTNQKNSKSSLSNQNKKKQRLENEITSNAEIQKSNSISNSSIVKKELSNAAPFFEKLAKSTTLFDGNSDSNNGNGTTTSRTSNEENNAKLGLIDKKAEQRDQQEKVKSMISLASISKIRNTHFPISIDDASSSKQLPNYATQDLEKKSYPWSIFVSGGVSNWNFNLNDNLLSALDPADFSHFPGSAYHVNMGVQKSVSKRLAFSAALGYESVNFDSGHNSVVQYDLANEANSTSNSFNLTMASPIGFINSNIIVDRLNSDQPNLTDIVIDLDNEHSMSQWNAELLTHLTLFNRKNLSLNTNLGWSGNYLNKISNNLSLFSPLDNNVKSNSSEITQDQQNITTFTNHIVLGANVQRFISSRFSIFADYNYHYALNPIFALDDFQTTINKHKFALKLIYQLR